MDGNLECALEFMGVTFLFDFTCLFVVGLYDCCIIVLGKILAIYDDILRWMTVGAVVDDGNYHLFQRWDLNRATSG